jgi:ParB-like chromosome segregation protein Spo0J
MSPAALDELAEDIKQNGLAHPVVRAADGIVLDGRSRLRACEIAGVEPRFETYAGGDPVGFIVSSNLKRRQLTESQRALVAARFATLARGRHRAADDEAERCAPSEAQMRKIADLDPAMTQAAAAAAVNVSKRSVQFARVVLDHGDPELIAEVEEGLLSVSSAAKKAKPPKPRPAPTRSKAGIDIRPIRSAFRRVEKSVGSGNVNKLRDCLGQLRRAVGEALDVVRDSTSPS